MTGGIEGGGPTLDRDKVYEEVTFGQDLNGKKESDTQIDDREERIPGRGNSRVGLRGPG